VATHEAKRGRGYGRALLEGIEQMARSLQVPRIMLCSTREESVQTTWQRLGFSYTTEEEMATWDIFDADMVHMQNTVQMTKLVPPPRRWRSLVIRHRAFRARTWLPLDPPTPSPALPARPAAASTPIGATPLQAPQRPSTSAGTSWAFGEGGTRDADETTQVSGYASSSGRTTPHTSTPPPSGVPSHTHSHLPLMATSQPADAPGKVVNSQLTGKQGGPTGMEDDSLLEAELPDDPLIGQHDLFSSWGGSELLPF